MSMKKRGGPVDTTKPRVVITMTREQYDNYLEAICTSEDQTSEASHQFGVIRELFEDQMQDIPAPEPKEIDTFEKRATEFRLTAADWQLFHGKEGMDEAVIVLNAALKSVWLNTDDDYIARDIMYGVMDRYIDLGARDTEPECCLVGALQIIYKNPDLER